jgi:hypothetical protein
VIYFFKKLIEKIKILSSELKDVRHKYFGANNRADKQKLQGKDKQLRKKISEQLDKDRLILRVMHIK